jgi:hypothetical protein
LAASHRTAQLQASTEPSHHVAFEALYLGSAAMAGVAMLVCLPLLLWTKRPRRALAWLGTAAVLGGGLTAHAWLCLSRGEARKLGVPPLFLIYDVLCVALFEYKCALDLVPDEPDKPAAANEKKTK